MSDLNNVIRYLKWEENGLALSQYEETPPFPNTVGILRLVDGVVKLETLRTLRQAIDGFESMERERVKELELIGVDS